MNGGPGVIGGLFVHDMHGKVESISLDATSNGDTPHYDTHLTYRPRLSGWWGSDKSSRFLMNNSFVPIPGASGFQLSNPSALDMTAVMASLDVFSLTTIDALRARSLNLTAYLEARLLRYDGSTMPPYKIITPSNPAERGAQISVLLNPGMLGQVIEILEDQGVVVDERKPDVIRIAPTPLYNSYWDIHRFMETFLGACRSALSSSKDEKEGENGALIESVSLP